MKRRLVVRALTLALFVLAAAFCSQCVSPDLNTGVKLEIDRITDLLSKILPIG